TVATNVTGGVAGKMISPQSLVVGTSSIGLAGREGELFRLTLPYSLLITFLVGVVALIQAYIFPWMIPAADMTSTTATVAASGGKTILLVTGLAITVLGIIIYRIRSDNQEK
ncbi:MAG: L-lactate permease, partial [Desulfotomaculaceae bacterium]